MTIAPVEKMEKLEPLLLNVRDCTIRVTAEEFDRLCQENPDLRLEMTREGRLIVMPPTFGDSGNRNVSLSGQLWVWNEAADLGVAFDSSTGYDFCAIDGGKMSPDVSWIAHSRLVGISLQQFIPVVPDFVIELRSSSDRLSDLQAKMQEYQRLGVRLGLLINPQDRQVEVYRLGEAVVVLSEPMVVDCGDVLLGFSLKLQKIW
jgi:Uma2 family endonuclease